MKDHEDASFVIGIQIQRDRTRRMLGLSLKAYIDKVLDRYGMKNCSHSDTAITKGDKLSLFQYSKNNYQKEKIKDIPYASAVGSLM